MKKKLLAYLQTFITDHRTEIIDKVLKNRTRYITVVLEDIYQTHNASAVLRSCDCFGIQDVHIIENRNKYRINPQVTLGSDKWLSIIKYNNSLEAIKELKKKEYRIVATTPHSNDILLEQFNLTKGKIALFFGTELNGLTQTVLSHTDEFIRIPMFGFTESYNISVSAGIILYHLTRKLRNSQIDWKLMENDIINLKIQWMKNSVKKGELIEKLFYKNEED